MLNIELEPDWLDSQKRVRMINQLPATLEPLWASIASILLIRFPVCISYNGLHKSQRCKTMITLYSDILIFVLSHAEGIYAKKHKHHRVKVRTDSAANRLITIFIFVTHTHDTLFLFSPLIRAMVPDSGWLTKEIKIELTPKGMQCLRSKSTDVASWKCNPTAFTSQLSDTRTKDNNPYKSVIWSQKRKLSVSNLETWTDSIKYNLFKKC